MEHIDGLIKETVEIINQTCRHCDKKFDQDKHQPMMLCIQQHINCLACTNQLLKNIHLICPQCKRQIKKEQITKYKAFHTMKHLQKMIKKRASQIETSYLNILRQKEQIHEKANQRIKFEAYYKDQNLGKYSKKYQQKYQQLKQKFSLFRSMSMIALESAKQNQNCYKNILLKYGVKIMETKKYEDSIFIHQQLIQKDLQFDYKIQGLGNNYVAEGNYDGFVFQWYENQIKLTKIKQNPYDALSLCYSQFKHHYEEGKNWYERMLIISPLNYQLMFGLANLQSNNGNNKKAIQLYQAINRKLNMYEKACMMLALIYYHQNNRLKSQQMANMTLRLNFQNKYAAFIKLKCANYSPQTQICELILIYNKFNDYAKIPLAIGENLMKLNNPQDTIQSLNWFKIANRLNPNYYQVQHQIGQSYYNSHNYFQAIEWYKKCIEKQPQNAQINFKIGHCCEQIKKKKQAMEWYNKCMTINPKYPLTYNKIGLILQKEQNYEEALNYYIKSYELNPQNEIFLNNVERCSLLLNDQSSTTKYLEKMLIIKPNSPQSHEKLVGIYQKLENQEKIIHHLTEWAKIDTQNQQLCERLIKYLQKDHQFKEAINWLNKLIKLVPEKEEQLFARMGRLYIKISTKTKKEAKGQEQ